MRENTSCIFVGNGKLLIACYEVLVACDIELRAVISDDPELIQYFTSKKISVYQNINSVKSFDIDYLFSINNQIILPQDILSHPKKYAINYHDALLPNYGGFNATAWAIFNQETQHGVTWHLMSIKVDAGDILEQELIEIAVDETAFSLNIKCFEAAIQSFERLCKHLQQRLELSKRPHKLNQKTFHYATQKPIYNGIINCCNNYESISALVRSCFWGNYDNTFTTAKVIIENYAITVEHVNSKGVASNEVDGVIYAQTDTSIFLCYQNTLVELTVKNFSREINFIGKQVVFYNSDNFGLLNDIQRITLLAAKNEKNTQNNFLSYIPNNIIQESYFKVAQQLDIVPSISIIELNFNEMELEKVSEQYTTTPQSVLLAIFFIYFLKTVNNNISYGYMTSRLPAFFEDIYSAVTPFNLHFSSNYQVNDICKYAAQILSDHGIFASDVLQRNYALKELSELSPGELFPLIFGTIFPDNSIPLESIYIQVCDHSLKLYFDLNRLNPEIWNKQDKLPIEQRWRNLLISQLNFILSEMLIKETIMDMSICPKIYNEKVFAEWPTHNIEAQADLFLHTPFVKQAKLYPNNTAIICQHYTISYHELLTTAFHYFKIMIKNGFKPTHHAVIFADKGWQQVVSCFSILFAGGCYIPFSTNDPDARLVNLLTQSDATIVLCDSHNMARAKKLFSCPIVEISDIYQTGEEPIVEHSFNANNPAYIIFTSGTTGTPKGVVTSHAAAWNTIVDMNQRIQLTSKDKALFLSELFFDLSVYDIFGTLAVGATLIIPHQDEVREPHQLLHYISTHHVSVWNSVPAYFYMLIEYVIGMAFDNMNASLRIVLLSGDWIPVDLPKKVQNIFPKTQLLSLGGATEASIWSIYYSVDTQREYTKSIPYGYALSNQRIFVLDAQFHPCVPGVIGKIYIAGLGLAQGYIGDQQLTEKSFIQHPTLRHALYETGDLGRYYEDGCIEFCGRADTQTKISGHRIELKEIEFVAQQYTDIAQAIALTYHNSAKHLAIALFVTSKNNTTISIQILEEILHSALPNYMLPNRIMALDKFPKNNNGKIDYAVLKANVIEHNKTTFEDRNKLPKTLIEIIKIWESVLAVPVNSTDHFIALGGNSLSAVQIVTRLHKEFGYSFRLSDFYKSETPLKLFKNHHTRFDVSLPKFDHYHGDVELSENQKSLWFLNQQDPLSPFYNMAFAFNLKGELSSSNIKQIFNVVVMQFDALRSTVTMKNSVPHWNIKTEPHHELSIVSANSKGEAIQIGRELCQRPFNLETGPLFRVALIQYQNKNHCLLLINVHHIIFDGWSFSILIHAINFHFNKMRSKTNLQIDMTEKYSHQDYCHWQHLIDGSLQQAKDIQYWSRKLEAPPYYLDFPLDMKRPEIDNFPGKIFYFDWPEDISLKLKEFAQKNGCTLYSIMLSAFSILLRKYTYQDDMIIGGSYANRSLQEFESIIGFFASTLALRILPTKDKSFVQLVTEAHQTIAEAIDHQNIGFNKIVELVNPKRSLSNNPIFQVALVLLNIDFPNIEFDNIQSEPIDIDLNASRFDFTIYFYDQGDNVKGYVEYNTNLFLEDTIEKFIQYMHYTTDYFLDHPQTLIHDLDLSSLLSPQQYRVPTIPVDRENNYLPTSVVDTFLNHVKQHPKKIAIQYLEHTITYAELHQQACAIADNLCFLLGQKEKEFVGIYLGRSQYTIAAILGVLLSGRAFIPFDLSWPQERINQVISGSKMSCLISSNSLMSTLTLAPTDIFLVEDLLITETEKAIFSRTISLEDPAYVIYTSGTTGVPKGVEITHKNLAAFFHAVAEPFQLRHEDVWLQFHSYAFDVSVWEIFGALCNGATLLIPTEENIKSPSDLIDLVFTYKVTILGQTPTAFYQLQHFALKHNVNKLTSLRYVIFVGEKLNFQKLKWWDTLCNSEAPALINMYGITETTIYNTFYSIPLENCERSNSIIGKLLDFCQGIIVDDNGLALPPGIPGELYLLGDGLANGYLHNEEQTRQRFLNFQDMRAYKTGDLVKLRPDGLLEYHHRIDRQTKIRGYRIELEEIENILLQCSIVQDAVIVVDSSNTDMSRLLAFVTLNHMCSLLTQTAANKVDAWKVIFDQAYYQSEVLHSPEFNTAGWNSAFTREALSTEEMNTWLQHALIHIKLLSPQKILEIGVGTGMLLFGLLKQCRHYTATDISDESIRIVKTQLEHFPVKERNKVSIFKQSADNFHIFEKSNFDTIIINSVIQYFPNIEYLQSVIQEICDSQKASVLYIGDVRNFDLLDIYHQNLKAFSLKYKPAVCNFKALVDTSLAQEKELLISPYYFLKLKKELSNIKRINFFIKNSDDLNELNLFRYEAVLFMGDKIFYEPEITYLHWRENQLSLHFVENHLKQNQPDTFGIGYVPNPRCCARTCISQWLNELDEQLLYTDILRREAALIDSNFSAIKAIAKLHNYDVYFLLAVDNPLDFYHVAFLKKGLVFDGSSVSIPTPEDFEIKNEISVYNVPQLSVYPEKTIWEHLKSKLPTYSLPELITVLEAFPRNSSGKLDVKKMMRDSLEFNSFSKNIVLPVNQMQSLILKVWKEYLRNDAIGIDDNFFDVGGNSITSIMVVARLNDLGLNIGPKDTFRWQTIRELSANLVTHKNNYKITGSNCVNDVLSKCTVTL